MNLLLLLSILVAVVAFPDNAPVKVVAATDVNPLRSEGKESATAPSVVLAVIWLAVPLTEVIPPAGASSQLGTPEG